MLSASSQLSDHGHRGTAARLARLPAHPPQLASVLCEVGRIFKKLLRHHSCCLVPSAASSLSFLACSGRFLPSLSLSPILSSYPLPLSPCIVLYSSLSPSLGCPFDRVSGRQPKPAEVLAQHMATREQKISENAVCFARILGVIRTKRFSVETALPPN